MTARSPVTTVLALRIVVVPVTAPIVILVPAPNKLPVVTVVFNRLNVVALVVTSPPLTAKSPVTTVLALLIVVVPVAAPIDTVVPAPNRLPVVATVLNTSAVTTPLLVLIVAVPLELLPRTSNIELDPVAPRLIIEPCAPILIVPVVPVNTLTVPLVTSLDKLAVPTAVLEIFSVFPVIAPPTAAVVVAPDPVPRLIVPVDPILIIPVTLCHWLTVPLVTSVVRLIVPAAVELISTVFPLLLEEPILTVVAAPAPVPRLNVVTAPPILRVVAVAFNKLNVVALVVKSPPLTARSPVTTVLALLIVVVPVAAPIDIAVPAPAKFTEVALVLTKLNVAAVVNKSPPLTLKSPVIVTSRPTLKSTPTDKFFSMPTPPSTIRAPVSLSVLSVVFDTNSLGSVPIVIDSLLSVVTVVRYSCVFSLI